MIETAPGGYKFPDCTLQTTAGIASIIHDMTLKGNGTKAQPLGIAVPLTLKGNGPLTGVPSSACSTSLTPGRPIVTAPALLVRA
jgi:hypothetical protein